MSLALSGGRRVRVRLSVLAALLCAVLPCVFVQVARANDFEDFEAARSAYESADYAVAAQRFEKLGGGDTPALTNRSLLLEAKKYLGASYLFLNKLQLAEAEFERLVRLDPQYILDPLAFPEDVQRLFNRVKTRLDSERRVAEEEQRREQDRLARKEVDRVQGEQQRWARLTALAQEERVMEQRSRWIALMPFGIGQFQNGHGSLGAILAVSEVSLLLVSLVSWGVHENLRGTTPATDQRDDYNLTERVSRYTNQVSLGLFGVIAITGIIDAQVRFEGDAQRSRKRVLPPDLRDPPRLTLTPTSLRLQF
jgi:tetratricopeptide (TPR) repeat protein